MQMRAVGEGSSCLSRQQQQVQVQQLQVQGRRWVPAAVATPLYSKLRLCACPRALHIAAKSAEHVWSASECVCVCVWRCNIIHQAASRASARLSQLVIAAGETGTRPWACLPACPFLFPLPLSLALTLPLPLSHLPLFLARSYSIILGMRSTFSGNFGNFFVSMCSKKYATDMCHELRVACKVHLLLQ